MNIDLDGIDISNNMIKKSKEKNIYKNLLNINLFTEKLNIDFKYDYIVSRGVFLEGHVNLKMISILINHLKKDGFLIISIRESYLEKNNLDYINYVKNNSKLNVMKED